MSRPFIAYSIPTRPNTSVLFRRNIERGITIACDDQGKEIGIEFSPCLVRSGFPRDIADRWCGFCKMSLGGNR